MRRKAANGTCYKDLSCNMTGVWVTEFTLDSIGTALTELASHLDGSLFLASASDQGSDGYLLASSSSSVSGIQLASLAGDEFISGGTQTIWGANDNLFYGIDGSLNLVRSALFAHEFGTNGFSLQGHNVVSGANSILGSNVVNVMSIARGQIYQLLDDTLDVLFVVPTLVMSIMMCVAVTQAQRTAARIEQVSLAVFVSSGGLTDWCTEPEPD